LRQHSTQIETLEELRQSVADTLGRLEMLMAEQFELTQQVLYRAKKPCGVLFCLHGPERSVSPQFGTLTRIAFCSTGPAGGACIVRRLSGRRQLLVMNISYLEGIKPTSTFVGTY
jgi:hypothetical protein